MEKCAIKGCKSKQSDIEYLGKLMCGKCWAKYSDKPVNVLRAALGLKLQEAVVVRAVCRKESRVDAVHLMEMGMEKARTVLAGLAESEVSRLRWEVVEAGKRNLSYLSMLPLFAR